MRGLRTWAWAVVIAATAGPASAQFTTGTTGGTTGTTGTGGITGGTTSRTTSSSGSSLSSSSTGLSGSSGTNSNSTNNGLATLDSSNVQFTNIGITGTSSLQKSNVFASFYANPYALGLSSSAGAGGFGQPLFGTTSGATGGAGRTGATGTTGRAGLNNNAANQSGILIPLPVQLAYSAQVQFPTPKVATPRLQADLRGIIDAGGLASPAGVQVVADADNNVTLRGTVKDDDEKRLAEGLVRLTPGVGTITNELTYPVAGK